MNGDANDVVGSNNGTIVGANLVADRLGNPSSAYSFNGTSDYIEIPTNFDFPEKTVCLWFKANSITSTLGTIFTMDDPTLVHGNMAAVTKEVSGVDYIMLCAAGNASFCYDYPIAEGTWYHLAMVKSSTGYQYYINCVLVASYGVDNGTSASGDPVTRIGAPRLLSINRYFNGVVDQMSVSNCALSAVEVCNVYNSIGEVNSTFSFNRLNIYPNPVKVGSLLSIEIPDPNENGLFTVTNMLGETIFSATLSNQMNFEWTISSKIIPGIYNLSFRTSKGAYNSKITVVN